MGGQLRNWGYSSLWAEVGNDSRKKGGANKAKV
jgi:hypothetical protein